MGVWIRFFELINFLGVRLFRVSLRLTTLYLVSRPLTKHYTLPCFETPSPNTTLYLVSRPPLQTLHSTSFLAFGLDPPSICLPSPNREVDR